MIDPAQRAAPGGPVPISWPLGIGAGLVTLLNAVIAFGTLASEGIQKCGGDGGEPYAHAGSTAYAFCHGHTLLSHTWGLLLLVSVLLPAVAVAWGSITGRRVYATALILASIAPAAGAYLAVTWGSSY